MDLQEFPMDTQYCPIIFESCKHIFFLTHSFVSFHSFFPSFNYSFFSFFLIPFNSFPSLSFSSLPISFPLFLYILSCPISLSIQPSDRHTTFPISYVPSLFLIPISPFFHPDGYIDKHITFKWEEGLIPVPNSLKVLPQYILNDVTLSNTYNIYVVGKFQTFGSLKQ